MSDARKKIISAMAGGSDPYGLNYESTVGQGDMPDIVSTNPGLYPQPAPAPDRNAGAVEKYMPQGLVDWGHGVKNALEQARGKPTVIGKTLGLLGLDESGKRAATSWGDAALSTLHLGPDLIDGVVGSAQNVAQNDGQSFHTSPDAADRARAAQYSGDVFNLAGAIPLFGAGASAAGAHMVGGRPSQLPQVMREHMAPVLADAPTTAPRLPGGLLARDGSTATKTSAYESYLNHLYATETNPQPLSFPNFNKLVSQSGVTTQRIAGRDRWIGIDATPPLHDAGQYSPLHNIGDTAREMMPPPGQDPIPNVTRMDGSALYANSKEGALPGLVLQGYRGHNPDLGIGPRPDKVQAVFATPDEFLAQRFAKRPEGDGIVSNVEMRFENPYVVDAKGNNFDNVPVRDGSNVLSRLLSPTMRYNIDDLAREKAAAGHDGMIVKNVRETGAGSTKHTADQYAALQRGTVYDPATGNLLWSNSKEASLPGLLSQGGDKPKSLMERLKDVGPDTGATILSGYHGNTGLGAKDSRTFWGSSDRDVAAAYADPTNGRWREKTGATPYMKDVEFRFQNPKTVDAKGEWFDSLPGGEPEDIARRARSQGHDGLILKNVIDPPYYEPARPADTIAALNRGTVYDRNTGKLIFSNPEEASPLSILSQGKDTPQGITALVKRYGFAGAAAMLGMANGEEARAGDH